MHHIFISFILFTKKLTTQCVTAQDASLLVISFYVLEFLVLTHNISKMIMSEKK